MTITDPNPVTAQLALIAEWRDDLGLALEFLAVHAEAFAGIYRPYLNARNQKFQVLIMCRSDEELAVVARALAAGAPIGSVRKDMNGYYYGGPEHVNIVRDFGTAQIVAWAARENVCTREVVGTETVNVPDPAELERVPLIQVEVDVVEWRCAPILDGYRTQDDEADAAGQHHLMREAAGL